MTSLRLAIITNHFWPHFGPAEMAIADTAEAIGRLGHEVEIITIRWEKNWPLSFRFRNLEVTRISRFISGPWGMFRFLRKLNRYVLDAKLDGMIVYGMRHESWAIIRSFAASLPIVVCVDQTQIDQLSRKPLNQRQRRVLQNVKQILVDSLTAAEQLVREQGIEPIQIAVAAPAVLIDADYQRTPTRQGTARIALSDAHPILQIEPTQPLVVCGSPHFADAGMIDLIAAWPHVLDRFPKARLWILGDGLKAREVWEEICEHGLADSIIMPGFFDSLDDVYQAADMYVHPLVSASPCPSLVRALSAGVCTVATSNVLTSALIEKNVNGLLTPPSNPAALAEAINLALNRSVLRDRLGRAARKSAIQHFDVEKQIDAYLNPFAELCENRK